MTLKNAAFLALIGTALGALLLLYNFIAAALNVIQGLVPAMTLFPTLVYAFASLTVAVFFYAFHKQR